MMARKLRNHSITLLMTTALSWGLAAQAQFSQPPARPTSTTKPAIGDALTPTAKPTPDATPSPTPATAVAPASRASGTGVASAPAKPAPAKGTFGP